MSLYRQPGRVATRSLVIAGVVALVVGAAIGFVIGRSTKSDPSLREQVAELRSAVAPARDGLELVQTEYAQAVHGGKVVAQTEYQAAQADVKRARDAVASHSGDLAALDPAATATLQQRLAGLAAAIDAKADRAAITTRAHAAQRALDAVAKHGADLAALDPAGTALLRQRLAALAQAVDAKADGTELVARARAAQRALDAVAGAPAG